MPVGGAPTVDNPVMSAEESQGMQWAGVQPEDTSAAEQHQMNEFGHEQVRDKGLAPPDTGIPAQGSEPAVMASDGGPSITTTATSIPVQDPSEGFAGTLQKIKARRLYFNGKFHDIDPATGQIMGQQSQEPVMASPGEEMGIPVGAQGVPMTAPAGPPEQDNFRGIY